MKDVLNNAIIINKTINITMNSNTFYLLIDILFYVILLSLFITSYLRTYKKIQLAKDKKMKLAFIFIGIVNTCALLTCIYLIYRRY